MKSVCKRRADQACRSSSRPSRHTNFLITFQEIDLPMTPVPLAKCLSKVASRTLTTSLHPHTTPCGPKSPHDGCLSPNRLDCRYLDLGFAPEPSALGNPHHNSHIRGSKPLKTIIKTGSYRPYHHMGTYRHGGAAPATSNSDAQSLICAIVPLCLSWHNSPTVLTLPQYSLGIITRHIAISHSALRLLMKAVHTHSRSAAIGID